MRVRVIAVSAVMGALAGWGSYLVKAGDGELAAVSPTPLMSLAGDAQLVSYQPFPEMQWGEACRPISAGTNFRVALWQQNQFSGPAMMMFPSQGEATRTSTRGPLRVIRDPYPAYSSVAVDLQRDEVAVTDENLFQILVYDRLANTSPTARTEPKRVIQGLNTKIEFQCGLYIDQKSGDIYAVNNDTMRTLVVFSRQAKGDIAPDRELYTPQGTFGIAVDEEAQELFLTVQHDNAVVVFRKLASKDEAPIRLLQGKSTRLADPHGMALDTKNGLIFVANHGSLRQTRPSRAGRGVQKENWPLGRDMIVPGSGKFVPPSITVYSKQASGDTPPVRVIQGPRTLLNWPTGVAIDPAHDELFVASDMRDSILVFRASADGDVSPIRILQGPNTGINNPTGLFLDTKNDELWVTNFGNHTATVYRRTAGGDTAPLRTIRSAPMDAPSLMIGNPGAVEYDPKRKEILVPN
ncbi:hypothetical protein MYX82_02635 [Acidobacteria bacterium AH-259-D05]|nr:hypothetical protein [Acidobacteria bacterium AH-259-D05]